MKKQIKRVLAFVLTVALLVPMLSVGVMAIESDAEEQPLSSGTPFEYVTAGNKVSDSYKGSKFYERLTKLKITGDQRTDVIAVALTQSGYLESDNENDFAGTYVGGWKDFTEYNYNMGDWGAGYGYDESIGAALHWCASFVSWAILQGRAYTLQIGSISDWCRKHDGSSRGEYDASYIWREVGVGHWADQLKRAGYFRDAGINGGTYAPLTGDIIFFTWDGTSRDHIGLVVYSDENYVYTVEGNTDDSEFADNSACCAVKSYPLNSKYIYGYGAMPYETVEGAAKVDFSGKTRTTGYYMNTNAAQNLYADKECQGTIIGRIERNTMFDVIEVCDNGMLKVVSEVYGGTTRMGYINPNKTRTLQISNEKQDAKRMLQLLADSATGIYYKEYTEETLVQIRDKYTETLALLADETATEADYNEAYASLAALLDTKSPNAATAGARVDYIDKRIEGGICTILTTDFNGGKINSTNANLTYAVAIKAKWDEASNGYVINEMVSYAIGVPCDTVLAEDEILIAAHDWETNVTEDPVFGSADNFKSVRNARIGQVVKLYGIDMETKTLSPGAYISIEGEGTGSGPLQPDISNLALNRPYTGEGYKVTTGQWPASYNAKLTDNVYLNEISFAEDDWFGFCRSAGSNGSNTQNGVGSVVIDLGESKGIKSIKVNTFVGEDSGIAAPARISACVAENADGPFVKMGDLAVGEAFNNVAWADLEKTANGRYVKIEVELKAGSAFAFINEVMVLGGALIENPEITYPPVEPDVPVDPPVEPDPPVDPELPDEPDFVKGDINGKDGIDSMDYVLLKRAYFGTYKLSDIRVGDINGNDEIDSMDYVYLRRAYFGTYVIK